MKNLFSVIDFFEESDKDIENKFIIYLKICKFE
jgi:hypothetical protein